MGRAVSRHSATALETSHARQCCQRKGLLIVHLLTVYLLSHDVATSNVVHVVIALSVVNPTLASGGSEAQVLQVKPTYDSA